MMVGNDYYSLNINVSYWADREYNTQINVRSTTLIHKVINAYFQRLGRPEYVNICAIQNKAGHMFDHEQTIHECGIADGDDLIICEKLIY